MFFGNAFINSAIKMTNLYFSLYINLSLSLSLSMSLSLCLSHRPWLFVPGAISVWENIRRHFQGQERSEGSGGLQSCKIQVVLLKQKMIAPNATPGEQRFATDFC